MKVSNNALNFLLAQYRAIFKRAYVKGLASAVLLTAGLAAGQAQADILSGTTALSGEEAITITGVSGSTTGYDYLQIKGSGSGAEWNADVTISGGQPVSGASGNYIQASGGALALEGTGSLKINITDPETEVASGGLLIQGGASGGVTVNIAEVDVTRGTLKLNDGNQSGGAKLIAGDITVGSATGTAGTGNGVIELTAASGGTVTLGDNKSTISVNGDGQLIMNISSGSGTVSAQSLSVASGGLFKISGSGTTIVTTTDDLDVAEGGFFTVTGSGTTTTFNGPSAKVDGNLLIDSGSKLNLGTNPATGTVTLGKNSNTQIGGTLTVNSGTLEVADGATLNATSTSGALAVSASDSGAVTTLRIDSDTLAGFLNSGSTDLTKITADGKLDGTVTDNNGQVNLTAGSGTVVLEFSDTYKTVDLTDYKFSGSAAAGYIQVSGSVTASGTDIAVSKKIDNASSLSIVANKLTLGDAEYSGTATLGFGEATARNLILQTSNDSFTLVDDVTLDVTLGNEDADLTVTNGAIQGDLTLASGSGSLTVAHGTYSHAGKLTISGGILKVTNEDRGDAGNLDSILDLDKGLTIQNISGSTISVVGGVPGVTTALDISDIKSADFVVNSGAVAAKVEAKNGGMIIATGEQLGKLLQTSGSAPYVEDGTFLIVDDATLDASALTSGTSGSATKFTFSSGSGGTLQVDGELAINGSGGTFALNLGDNAEVIAETLNLTNASGNAPSITYSAATLQSGKYTALKSLTSENSATDIQVSGAKVFLGGIDGDGSNTDPYTALSTRGTIGSKLTVNSASGSLSIESGRWSAAQDLAVSAGKLTIGFVNADGNGLADAQGNAITAGLSATTLNLSGTGSAVVTKVGTLTVDELTTSAKTLEVQGTAIINGNRVTSGTGTSATTTYGINLAANSIDVGVGATVTIGEDATSAITVSKDKNTTDKYLTIADGTFNGKVFTVESAGEVQFSFGDTVVFNKDSIAEFRDTLFNYDTQKGVIDGFINLGDAQIKGLAVDEKTGTVAWDTLKGYTDIIADVTTQGLADAKVTGITDGANVRGNVGSLETTADYAADVIQVDGNLTLNNAAANGGNFASTTTGAVLGLDVTAPADVVLNNGGNIGDITFSEADSSLTVNSAQGTTKIAAIDGSEANVAFTTGTATVAGATTAATLSTAAGTTTTFTGAVTVGEDAVGTNVVSNIAGTTTFEDDASFAQAATFAGSTTFKQDVSFEDAVTVNGGTTSVNTQGATATFAQGASILGGGLLQAQNVVLDSGAASSVFAVGSDTTAENQTGTGYLEAASFTLAGNDLVVDPAYGQRTSIAAIKGFADEVSSETDAGVVDGRIFVGQNAALDVGTTASIAHMQEFIKNYQTNNGSLVQDEVGAVMYVSDKLTVKNDGRIILDSQNGQDRLLSNAKKQGQYGVDGKNADMFLGKHTVLAIGDNILEDGSAIHFDKIGAGIMAEDGSATVVLDGDKFLNSSSITLFTDNDGGVMVMGDQDIRVETLNGVMYFMLEAGKVTEAKSLQLDTYKIDSAYLGATDESRNLLLAYASRTANWEEYYSQDLTTPGAGEGTAGAGTAGEGTSGAAGEGTQTPTPPARVERDPLVAGLASPGEAYLDANDKIVVTSAAQQAGLTADDFVIVYEDVEVPDTEAGTEGASTRATVQQPVLYRVAHNEFLEAVARNTDGRALDSASLQGVFAGSAQAALLAARTSQDAVAGRTGVGASSSALTFADNGQGGGVWVAPIYVSQDSDGFAVENKDYGVDIDLYGVALGGDYTLANGVRVGAFFNVGSGDADGNGQASGVSNDFDYYGVGLYAGYNVGQFSVVGDLSYTAVDSDVEASTSVGKLSSSFDTDNFSVGVTGQYQFVFGATTVTPHAGLRYSALSIDDYRIETGYADGGNFDSDNLSVFSIPVGVTIAQEFTAGSWNVKPSFDLTLSGNFGDDEIDANTNWDGVANWSSQYTAEFIDNFTYGATLGVAAKSGNFSAGIGVSYTGSENTDEFGATANARFTF